MGAHVEPRRYLVNVDTRSTHQLFTDCLVIGAGIAGLRAAIEAAETVVIRSRKKDNQKYLFVMNFNPDEAECTLDATYHDLIADKDVSGTVKLSPRDVMILRK